MASDLSQKRLEDKSGMQPRLLRIRPSVASDLLFVIRLSERVFRVYGPYGKILGLSFLQQRVLTLLALESGKRAGFAMLSSVLTVMELAALAVLPPHQGKGVGRALLREAIRWSERQGANRIILHTAEGNIRAQNLFFSEDFVVDGWIEGYYPGGQTAVQLYRPLANPAHRMKA